jgi:predicted HicB family RNase H-like nuclease
MTAKFASLHVGLLARKGEAVPVFKNPNVSYVDAPPPDGDSVIRRDVASVDGLPLIADKKALADRYSDRYDAELALTPGLDHPTDDGDEAAVGPWAGKEMNGAAARAPAGPGKRPAAKTGEHAHEEHDGPYRFSFRMAAEQRRRLRIAAAQKDCTLSQALGEALDRHLAGSGKESGNGKSKMKGAAKPAADNAGQPSVVAAAPPEPIRAGTDDDHHGPSRRFSFRMSPDQHRRLRLAATPKGWSLQHQLSEALDRYLDGLYACSLKDCACLARRDGGERN